MATMKSVRHEMLKKKWSQLIKDCHDSGLTVKRWCQENDVRESQYYYWLKIIREESLVQAGTLAITRDTQFAEVSPQCEIIRSPSQNTCVVLHSGDFEIEILNGADPETLANILSVLKKSC